MASITSIAARDGGGIRRMALRRALLTRRANLSDCWNAASLLRSVTLGSCIDRAAAVIPLPLRSRGERSALDFAVDVSRLAIDNEGGSDPQAFGGLIYCHASPDEHGTDSSAGRLQHDLGLKRANSFSVSQAHNTSLLVALDIAVGLIEGPEASEAVLVVAADKLVYGRAPHDPRQLVCSDVAAAAVLRRNGPGGWRIDHIVLRHFATPYDAFQAWPEAERLRFGEFAAETILACLSDLGMLPSQLTAVLAHCVDDGFVRLVNGHICAPASAPALSSLRSGFSSCADLLLCLSRLEPGVSAGQSVLAWSQGDNGEFACAVMTRSP